MTKDETGQIRVRLQTRKALNAAAKIRETSSYDIADKIITEWLEQNERQLLKITRERHVN